MPSPERGGGPSEPDRPQSPEHEPNPYHRVARFADEQLAARVYRRAEAAIHATPCDVSVYRFLLDQVTHVAAIGAPPPAALDDELAQLLASGEPATLPPVVLQQLIDRRRRASQVAPWVEGHYRLGWRL